MASTISSTKCPHCGRSAIEDYYYKTDETMIVCYRCGFYYSRRIEDFTTSPIQFKEEKYEGYGVFILMKKDGNRKATIFNKEISQEEISEYQKNFHKMTLIRKKVSSYLQGRCFYNSLWNFFGKLSLIF